MYDTRDDLAGRRSEGKIKCWCKLHDGKEESKKCCRSLGITEPKRVSNTCVFNFGGISRNPGPHFLQFKSNQSSFWRISVLQFHHDRAYTRRQKTFWTFFLT